MTFDKSLLSGSTTMLLLKLLEEKDMYGYLMIEELSKKSDYTFELKAGTLYPLLHNLELKGKLESYESISETGKSRKYYKLTKKGKLYLKEKQKEWNEYTTAVNRFMGGVQFGTL